MKKILIYISAMVLVSSCTKLSLNDDPKKAQNVPGETLVTSAEKNLFDYMTSNSQNLNVFRLLAQQQAQVTYIEESRYDFAARNVPQGMWHALYRDVLKDLSTGKAIIEATPALSDIDQTIKDNKLAVIDILESYTYYVLVTCYGNLPYKEAGDWKKLNPVYDDQKAVFLDLLTRLKADIDKLDPAQPGLGGADLIYKGDVTKWTKFANSLRLRMGLILADVQGSEATAVEVVNDAAKNVFTSAADNFAFPYLSSEPNTNPIWVDLVKSNRLDYVVANTLVDLMNGLSDPRRPLYYTPVTGNTYVGGIYGKGNSYASYSHISAKVLAANFESLLLDYSEVEFALAEAAARGGFTITGTAEEHYNKAVTASINYWGGSAQDAATYLAQSTVAYATAAGTYKQKIGTQKYIALYNRGYDAWTEWRRLDFPILNAPPDIAYANIPVRLPYPVTEQNLNQANYDKASKDIGGDLSTTKLFWNKE